MPNQGNKSNGKSGVVQSKKQSTIPAGQKQGSASATKNSRGEDGKSKAGSSGKGGSKTISSPNSGD